MNKLALAICSLALLSAPAVAQFPPPVPAMTVQAAQAQLVANSGSDSVFFGPGEARLDPPARQTLAAQAAFLNANPYLKVRIEGHSDGRGTREYSIGVAERRAFMVRNFLISLGVEPARLTVVSYGKERPTVAGANQAAWALNRRVVTKIEP